MKKIAYYPGCSLEKTACEYDWSARAVCDALGVELVEIPNWTCCGSTPSNAYDPLLGGALAGRNLAIAENQLGLDTVMTPCPSCLKSLKGALKTYQKKPEAFLKILDMPFSGNVRPISVLQLLYEEVGVEAIREKVIYPLTGRVIVPYYGCLLTRPPEFADFDDPENPISMDKLLEAIGATVPYFSHKTECCGASFGVTEKPVVGKLTGRILEAAEQAGAEAITLACQMCQQNLDLRQGQVNKYGNTAFKIPIIYITQLIGHALGIDAKTLGIDKLIVNADSLFEHKPSALRA
ncbi:MAG: CoB--CoM heterodisulfide reductase iron-sulfur subunit B family protein [Desulfobacterales bacterium]|nr:CoB--CoM heterodisulfide reductase iron-sulfur subunit B family protein [Desulfobacterales bacterium]MDD4394175.1 CoB--CoM heterodisulfide reductase iron-sulfur subunit B family protein [Desulfobacterales bacterium]